VERWLGLYPTGPANDVFVIAGLLDTPTSERCRSRQTISRAARIQIHFGISPSACWICLQKTISFRFLTASQNFRSRGGKRRSRQIRERSLDNAAATFWRRPSREQFPNQLSAEEQQRVAIARALATTRGSCSQDERRRLDSERGRQVMGMFRDGDAEGVAVCVVTPSLALTSISTALLKYRTAAYPWCCCSARRPAEERNSLEWVPGGFGTTPRTKRISHRGRWPGGRIRTSTAIINAYSLVSPSMLGWYPKFLHKPAGSPCLPDCDRQLPMKELALLVRDLQRPRPLVYCQT